MSRKYIAMLHYQTLVNTLAPFLVDRAFHFMFPLVFVGPLAVTGASL
jgi:hypothetical protein